MITTAVQPASRMVEIQGAPPAMTLSEDTFHIAFAASVSGSRAQDAKAATVAVNPKLAVEPAVSGSPGKQAAVAELLAKNPSNVVLNRKQRVVLSVRDATKAALNSATVPTSATKQDSGSDRPIEIEPATETSVDLAVVGSGPLPNLAAQKNSPVSKQAAYQKKIPDADAKPITEPVALVGVPAPVDKAKSNEPAKPLASTKAGGSDLVRGRSEDALAPNTEIALGVTQTIAPSAAVPIERLSSKATAVPPGYSEAGPAIVAPAVLTVTVKSIDSSSPPTVSQRFDLIPAGALEVMETTNTSAKAVVVAAAKDGSRGEQSFAASHRTINLGTSVAVSADTAAVPGILLTAIDPASGLKQQSVGVPTETASTVSDGAVKTGAASDGTDASPVSLVRSIAKPQPALALQSSSGFVLEGSKATKASTGSALEPVLETRAETGADHAANSHAVDNASGVQAVAPSPKGLGQSAQTPDPARDLVPLSTPPSNTQDGASSKVSFESKPAAAVAETKGEKAKPFFGAAAETPLETSSASSQSPVASSVNVPTSSSLASANGLAAVTSTGNSGGGVVLAHTAETVVSPSPTAALSAALPQGAHALSAASSSTYSESSATTSQVAESHRTLLATPTALEVGVQSGTQGWLRIRAEVGGQGEVNTSLAAASSSGRELLHSQMPALNAFLHSEQIAATATVVDRVPSTTAGLQGGTAMGSGGPGNQNGSGSSNSSLSQGGEAQGDRSRRDAAQPSSEIRMVSSYDAHSGISDAAVQSSGSVAIFEESGRWLNVRV